MGRLVRGRLCVCQREIHISTYICMYVCVYIFLDVLVYGVVFCSCIFSLKTFILSCKHVL